MQSRLKQIPAPKILIIMKKIVLFLAFFIGVSYICEAQPPKIQAIFVAYATKELNLTPDEAQKFWPVYNQYFEELKKVRQENQSDELAFEEKALNIRKKYKTDFKKVLNDDARVNKVYVLEKNFKEMLRKEIQNRAKNRPRGTKFQQPQD
jgi:hypothetical protein